MWTLGRGYVLVSQNGAQIRHFSENMHVVISHSWYNFVKGCEIVLETGHIWSCMSNVVYRHVSVCQKVSYRYDCLQWTRLTAFALVKSVFSGMVSYVKICILRRFSKLKSYGCTSFRVGQRWNTRCDMLNVTHIHVFVSQQVCRHQSVSVWTRAWTRLVEDSFVWKHGGRNKTLGDKLHTDTSSYVKIWTRTRRLKSNICVEGRLFTFNKSNSPSHQSNRCTRTWLRMLIVAYWEGFVS